MSAILKDNGGSMPRRGGPTTIIQQCGKRLTMYSQGGVTVEREVPGIGWVVDDGCPEDEILNVLMVTRAHVKNAIARFQEQT